MTASELYDLTHWLDKETKGTNLRALKGILQQWTPPIKERLSKEALNGVSLNALTKVGSGNVDSSNIRILTLK